jgi:hypothetical protein
MANGECSPEKIRFTVLHLPFTIRKKSTEEGNRTPTPLRELDFEFSLECIGILLYDWL